MIISFSRQNANLYQKTQVNLPLACQGGFVGGLIMTSYFKKRISISSCWAVSRIALLDSVERYEDSYAISQEFCEWITCINTYPEGVRASTLKVPNFEKEIFDADEILEL